MYYTYSPDTDYENDRTAGKSGVALQGSKGDAELSTITRRTATGAGASYRSATHKTSCGNIGNQSRLVSEVQVRKRFGACHDLKRATNSFTWQRR